MRLSSTELGILILLAFAGWWGWTHYEMEIKQKLGLAPPPPKVRVLGAQFQCDGRIYCAQMTSCEEVRFFIRYCDNTRLGRNGEGIDCEKQWCEGQGGRLIDLFIK